MSAYQVYAAISNHSTDMRDANSAFETPESESSPTVTATPMHHNTLTMRPNPNSSQESSSHASQQEIPRASADGNATFNPNSPMIHSVLTFNELHHMASETAMIAARRNLVGRGVQSLEDVEFFLRNLHYTPRNISNVQVLIGLGIRTREHGLLECSPARCHPASTCTTFPHLMEATTTDWEDAFADLNVPMPAEGVRARDLTIWYKRTYGDNQGDWIEARRHGEYTQWFNDYVVHGRSSVVHVLLRFKGPI